MSLGPYKTQKEKLSYVGNKIFKPAPEVRVSKPPQILNQRHLEIKKNFKKWEALIKIWDGVFKATNKFMENRKVLLFDLPIITRMISSPGALSGTISSDVDPFEVKFFNKNSFLTQSSQLYLEFAITNPRINSVYCWEKSFRRERADFRHLPEFSHIEFESNINFEKNLNFQKDYLQFLVKFFIENYKKEIGFFLNNSSFKELEKFAALKNFKILTFHEAFRLLKKKTNKRKYKKITNQNFGAYEEVLLAEIVNSPLFVINYIKDEVAFYHAQNPKNSDLVINADFLFPGYGELIGSGERIHTIRETKNKAKYFKLNMEDYQPYIESRDPLHPKIHSGWGMGIERFIQCMLKLPFIWETKPFPRVNNINHP